MKKWLKENLALLLWAAGGLTTGTWGVVVSKTGTTLDSRIGGALLMWFGIFMIMLALGYGEGAETSS